MREPVVYIMANKKHGTLYTGVTSDIGRRAYEHREGQLGGFTARYKCKLLIWFEFREDIIGAIEREKQIKAGSRQDKLILIESLNPEWKDLFDTLV